MAADTLVTSSKLTAIANAIRTKGGTSSTLTLDQMPQAVADLPSGGGGDRVIGAKAAYNYQSDLSYDFLAADFPAQGIRDQAFMLDNYIRNVVFPADNANVKQITTSMFVGSHVRSITIPARTDGNTWSLVRRNISIGGSGFSVPEYFTDCAYLTSIDLSNISQVDHAQAGMFKSCEKLQSITFPSSLSSGYWRIQPDDFMNCKKLASITIPDHVLTINDKARVFYGCTSLRTADLGAGISTLSGAGYGSAAFAGCSAMEKLVLRCASMVTLTAPYLFAASGQTVVIPQNLVGIYVPDALVDTYKANTNWSAYADYIKPLSEYVA